MTVANLFTLQIRLGGDAMQSYADVGRALREASNQLWMLEIPACEKSGTIRNDHGKAVGEWRFEKAVSR